MSAYTGRKLNVSPNAYKYDLRYGEQNSDHVSMGLPIEIFPDRFGNIICPIPNNAYGVIYGTVTLAYINPSGETVEYTEDISITISNS